MFKSIIKFVMLLTLLSGCSSQSNYRDNFVKIAVSSWVGYTPILYAYEKHRLENTNIKIISTTSVGVSLNFIKRDVVDAIFATQWEYKEIKEFVRPLFIVDESYGGDKILANIPKEDLYAQKYPSVDILMERDSVNSILYEYFVDSNEWNKTNFIVKNSSQAFIVSVEKFNMPTVVITYEPYASFLMKRGFEEIESSKNPHITIIDGLFVKKELLIEEEELFNSLFKEITLAIKALEKDPREYYETIKNYLEGQTYDEFMSSVHTIKWINKSGDALNEYYQRGIL